jgi:hypothetical protein
MNRLVILIAIFIIISSICLHAEPHSFQAGGGITFNLRFMYNTQGAPGAGGGGAMTWFRYQYKRFYLETGASWEICGIGMQVLFPISIGGMFFQWNRLALDAYGSIYPGIALFRPRPPAMIGVGGGIALRVRLSGKLGLKFYQEIRYITSPEYSQKVAPYHTLEMPFCLALYGTW